MESINYKPGLKKILGEIEKSAVLRKNGIDLMNRLMISLNSKLVSYCLQHSPNDIMNVITSRNAVEGLLTGNLKKLAFSEGDRVLMLYSNRLMIYEPRFPTKRKTKTKKAIAAAALKFFRGISDLVSVTFPEATLQDQSKRILCEMIEELALKISDFVQSKSKTSITKEDIRTALSKALPPELLKHALAEAARMIFLFEGGLIGEPSERTAVRTKPKHVTEKVLIEKPKKPRVTRKRKRSPTLKAAPRKRRKAAPRKSLKSKISRKRYVTKEVLRKKAVRRAPSRKRRVIKQISRKKAVRRAPPRKRRISKTISRKEAVRRVPSRKRGITKQILRKKAVRRAPSRKRRVTKKIPRKKAVRRVPSRKRRDSRKRSVRRKRSRRVPEKAFEEKPKKPKVMRKRKRFPSVKAVPSLKRRRKPSKGPRRKEARKVSRRKTIRRAPSRKRRASRKRIVRRKRPKHVPEKAFEEPKKPRISRKRKPSPSVKPVPGFKRRMPAKSLRRKAVRKISRRKPTRKISRKRTPSKEVERKVTRKKRARRKAAPRKPTRSKVPRKRLVSKEVSRKKAVRRAPSRKRRVSKKRPVVRKRPKVIRKKSPKEDKRVSGVYKITNHTKNEIGQGIKQLNASLRQKLPTPEFTVVRDFVCYLLDYLITELKNSKYSIIGHQEVRRIVMKIFPPNLADLAVAHMTRFLMT